MKKTAWKRIHATVLPWRLLDCITHYRKALSAVVALVLFIAALWLCWGFIKGISVNDIRTAVSQTPSKLLLLAALAAVGSYAMLVCYERLAMGYAGVRVPPSATILGGVCASAIGNAVGISVLSGGAVRCRLYFRYGLNATNVLSITVFIAVSLGLSLPLVAALAALANTQQAADALHGTPGMIGAAAGGLVALYALALVWIARHKTDQHPNTWSRIYQFGRWSLSLPTWRVTLAQFCINALDIVFAGLILYVLLPERPALGAFLLVYPLALCAGVLSNVPGGLGVFEAVMLAAFGSSAGAVPLTAALVLYRLIYVLCPLGVAGVLMLGQEAYHSKHINGFLRSVSGFAAPVMSALVFLSGVLLLFSGMIPVSNSSSGLLGQLVPDPLVNISHFTLSLIGVFCLLLSWGLRCRLAAAWGLTVMLLGMASLMCLLKGMNWRETLVLLCILTLLVIFRRAFYRKGRIGPRLLTLQTLAATLCVIAASVVLMFFIYQDTPYNNQLWWQFELDDNVPRALRAALGSFVLLGVLALAWLLKPPMPIKQLADAKDLRQALDIYRASDQPEGGLALSGDKSLLFNQTRTAFIMYARQRRSMIALFDPIGPASERADLIWQFRDLCDQHYLRPVFYQVKGATLPYYMDVGMTAIKLGEEAIVELAEFDLASKKAKDLRYAWGRAQRDGLTLEFFLPGQAPYAELKAISDTWLKSRNMREKRFSLGAFTTDYLKNFEIAAVRYEGNILAFASLLDTGSHTGAGLDLMRVVKKAPNLTMEFMMTGLILHYKEKQYRTFSLGMAPLAGLHTRRGAPLTQRLGAVVFRHGERVYGFQGLRRFKEKFSTRWEPRYLAVPPGLDPLLALVDTAMLISGGSARDNALANNASQPSPDGYTA